MVVKSSSVDVRASLPETDVDAATTCGQIDRLQNPRSVAVVGAGSSPDSIGGRAIAALRSAPLLSGARNLPRAGLESLSMLVSRISHLAPSPSGIDSIEVNPVLVLREGSGAFAVDALSTRGV